MENTLDVLCQAVGMIDKEEDPAFYLRRKQFGAHVKVETNFEGLKVVDNTPPISPLSWKKLNLSDPEPNPKDHKKRRSESEPKTSSLLNPFYSHSSPPSRSSSPFLNHSSSPPQSPGSVFIKEPKHDGNIIRLQISRNYSSASDAVDDHFTKSFSQEFLDTYSSSPRSQNSSAFSLERLVDLSSREFENHNLCDSENDYDDDDDDESTSENDSEKTERMEETSVESDPSSTHEEK